jgi:hypothetical protein
LTRRTGKLSAAARQSRPGEPARPTARDPLFQQRPLHIALKVDAFGMRADAAPHAAAERAIAGEPETEMIRLHPPRLIGIARLRLRPFERLGRELGDEGFLAGINTPAISFLGGITWSIHDKPFQSSDVLQILSQRDATGIDFVAAFVSATPDDQGPQAMTDIPYSAPIERFFRDLSNDEVANIERISALGRLEWGEGFGWHELLQSMRILIVSEAGAGKTYECDQQQRRLWQEGEAAFFLDLATPRNAQ